MAEALLQEALRTEKHIRVESAGLGALVGEGAAEHALGLMNERGLDISGHRAQQLTAELLAAADLILVMESGHKKAIDAIDSTTRGKVYRLGEWQDTEIVDPYRQSKAAFVDALEYIEDAVADWVSRITK